MHQILSMSYIQHWQQPSLVLKQTAESVNDLETQLNKGLCSLSLFSAEKCVAASF